MSHFAYHLRVIKLIRSLEECHSRMYSHHEQVATDLRLHQVSCVFAPRYCHLSLILRAPILTESGQRKARN